MRIEMVQEFTGLYMKIEMEEKTDNFGSEMLRHNNIEGILGAREQQVDHVVQYVYEIGSCISLAKLFQKRRITLCEFKQIFQQLICLLKKAGEYFLDERNLLLVPEYMFYDEKSDQLFAAYLDGYCTDVQNGISRILEIFMNSMNHQDKELVFFVYSLHRISKEENFCLKRLTECMEGDERKSTDNRQLVEKREYAGENRQIERQQQVKKERAEKWQHSPEQMPPQKLSQERNFPFYTKVAAYILAGVFVFVTVVRSGILDSGRQGNPDFFKMIVLALVLAMLAGYLIAREWGEKQKKKDVMQSENGDSDDTMILAGSMSDETVVLETERKAERLVNLIPEDWHREEIQIRKSPVFIGKDPAKSDGIIAEAEVSRVHAKIVIEENCVFVIDQESTNGTYVNGRRLVPWERQKINSNDIIGFSTIYYKVEIVS